MTSTHPLVTLRQLSFSRGDRCIFDLLDLSLGTKGHGSVVAVVGGSGVGKSTFLRLLAGLEAPCSGAIDMAAVQSMAFLSQEPVLFDHLSASDNTRYLQRAHGGSNETRFEQLSDALKLRSILASSTSVAELSGGERQRLAIMRALLVDPELILLDEPCAGLDPALRSGVIDGLQRAIRQSTSTALYVTHHLDEIALASDNVLYFDVPDAVTPVQVFLRTTREFLERPPTVRAVRFAHFPRSNVLRGHIGDGLFMVGAEPSAVSIAFMPRDVQWQSACAAARGAVQLHLHGAHGWADVAGESIAVELSSQAPCGPVVLTVQPGALVYDASGCYRSVVTKPLNII